MVFGRGHSGLVAAANLAKAGGHKVGILEPGWKVLSLQITPRGHHVNSRKWICVNKPAECGTRS